MSAAVEAMTTAGNMPSSWHRLFRLTHVRPIGLGGSASAEATEAAKSDYCRRLETEEAGTPRHREM